MAPTVAVVVVPFVKFKPSDSLTELLPVPLALYLILPVPAVAVLIAAFI